VRGCKKAIKNVERTITNLLNDFFDDETHPWPIENPKCTEINNLNLVVVINNQPVPVFFVNYTYENSQEYSSVIIKENQLKIRVRSGIVGR
jgi:hypothetical protein